MAPGKEMDLSCFVRSLILLLYVAAIFAMQLQLGLVYGGAHVLV